MTRSLVVKATAGADDPERCSQAFTVAAAAVAAGIPVSMWLTGEAAWLAVSGRAESFSLPHATPLVELIPLILASGTLVVCQQCGVRRDLELADLSPGIGISGATAFVAEVTAPDVQALVY